MPRGGTKHVHWFGLAFYLVLLLPIGMRIYFAGQKRVIN